MAEAFVNKVAESGIITLSLEDFIAKEDCMIFDLKDFLFMELILKEKDYREKLKNLDWEIYNNKLVGIICSTDAIIPVWAYMLAATYLQPIAKFVTKGNETEVKEQYLVQQINNIDVNDYANKRVVIKGCGDVEIPTIAYTVITAKLLPVTKSIMYGEPCSTVPVYKKKTT